jgi:hypothetical protein
MSGSYRDVDWYGPTSAVLASAAPGLPFWTNSYLQSIGKSWPKRRLPEADIQSCFSFRALRGHEWLS